MKCILLLAALCLSLSATAQTKKDTKITVTVQDTAGLFNKVAMLLYDKGYGIQRKDESLKVISSDEKTISSGSVKYRFILKDFTVIISGDVASNVTLSIGGAKAERSFSPIYYGGMKNSILRLGWNEMVSLAKELGTEIVYSK